MAKTTPQTRGLYRKKAVHNDLQKMVALKLQSLGGHAFNIVTSNRRGVPDIDGSICGIISVTVEVKIKLDKTSNWQQKILWEKINAGGIGLVIHPDNLDIAWQYLEEVAERVKLDLPVSKIRGTIPPELLPKELSVDEFESGGAL